LIFSVWSQNFKNWKKLGFNKVEVKVEVKIPFILLTNNCLTVSVFEKII